MRGMRPLDTRLTITVQSSLPSAIAFFLRATIRKATAITAKSVRATLEIATSWAPEETMVILRKHEVMR